MKRVGGLKDQIVDLDNIAKAAYNAFTGYRSKMSVANFCRYFYENISQIRAELDAGNIEIGRYTRFKIYDPKERLICAAPIRERIIHHAIMNICHHYFDSKLIYDTYASRPGKGVYKAIERLRNRMGSYPYFVKLDIRKYFDSIDHEVLKGMLDKMFKDRWLLGLFGRIIDSYCVNDGKGVPIGNLTSQYFANHYLCSLDHFMTEDVKVPLYVRYMDDVVILARSKDEVKAYAKSFTEYAESRLKLRVKPPIIGRSSGGVVFLGYRVFPARMTLSGRSKRRFRHKIITYTHLFNEGIIGEATYGKRLMQLCAFVSKADSKEFRRSCLKMLPKIDFGGEYND